jgi:hypothetical protein
VNRNPILDPEWEDLPRQKGHPFKVGDFVKGVRPQTIKLLFGGGFGTGVIHGIIEDVSISSPHVLMYRVLVDFLETGSGYFNVNARVSSHHADLMQDPNWRSTVRPDEGKYKPGQQVRFRAGVGEARDYGLIKRLLHRMKNGKEVYLVEGFWRSLALGQAIRGKTPLLMTGDQISRGIRHHSNPILESDWYEPKYKVGQRVILTSAGNYKLPGTVVKVQRNDRPETPGLWRYDVDTDKNGMYYEYSEYDLKPIQQHSENPILRSDWIEPPDPKFKVGDKVYYQTYYHPGPLLYGRVKKVHPYKGKDDPDPVVSGRVTKVHSYQPTGYSGYSYTIRPKRGKKLVVISEEMLLRYAGRFAENRSSGKEVRVRYAGPPAFLME